MMVPATVAYQRSKFLSDLLANRTDQRTAVTAYRFQASA